MDYGADVRMTSRRATGGLPLPAIWSEISVPLCPIEVPQEVG